MTFKKKLGIAVLGFAVILTGVAATYTAGMLELSQTWTGTNTFTGQLIDVDRTIDARYFGAKCDGVTDDNPSSSGPIQTAINWGINHGKVVVFPSGVCKFSTTINCTVGSTGCHIKGQTSFGSGAATLLYSGTGTAVNLSNGGGYVYTPKFENIAIRSTGSADKGLVCSGCSQGTAYNLTVGGLDTSHFNTAIDLSGSHGVFFYHPIVSYNTDAFLLTGSANTFIQHGDIFAQTGSVFKSGAGNVTGLTVKDSWVESENYLINFDDTGNSSSTVIENIDISGNNVIFNGGTVTYPNQIAINIKNGQNTNVFLMDAFNFHDNLIRFAGGESNTAYPIVLTFPASPNAGSWMNLSIRNNEFSGATTGLVTANHAQIRPRLFDNQNYNASRATLSSEVNGTASAMCMKSDTSGKVSIGCNSATVTISNAGSISATGLVAPTYQTTLSTPANSSAACTAGQMWADASYVYVCTASNTIKRSALSTF